jgi:hypothetical protein
VARARKIPSRATRSIGRRQEDTEQDDDDRPRLPAAEALASDQHGADDRHRGVGGDDRAHNRDRADGERPVEGEVGKPAEEAEEGEPGEVAAAHVAEAVVCGDDEEAEEEHGHQVEAEDDAESARPA